MELLATLFIFRDDSPGNESSYSLRKRGSKTHLIVLRPKGDMQVSKFGNLTVDVLAHELGHFVANVAETKAGKDSGWLYSTPIQNLASEKEAWEIAGKIRPDISPAIRKDAIEAYEETARKYPNIPREVRELWLQHNR